MSALQLYPPLDAATEAALRASIQRFGVLVAVTKDQHGRILDGHHRDRLARELGVKYLTVVRAVTDDDEAREIARTLNEDRRHLAPEERREVVAALREEGHSQRAIAGALKVDQKTVRNDLAETREEQSSPDRVTGLDGKSYPASKPKPKNGNGSQRRGTRSAARRDEPFEADTQRRRALALGQYERVSVGLAEIKGICRGLRDLDYGMAAAAASTNDLEALIERAGHLVSELRQVRSRLEEAHGRKAA